MKNKKALFLLPLFLLAVFSCEEELKLQEDPLDITQPVVDVTIPFAMVQYSNWKITGLGTRLMDTPRQFSATFNSLRSGIPEIPQFDRTWNILYSDVLVNFDLMEQRAMEIGEVNDNVRALCMIMKAMVYYELSMLWEDIPFTQALDPSIPEPEYDRQEDVLKGCVELLEKASLIIEELPQNVEDISDGDLIYKGDMDLWLRFSNSLKLRILMLIRNRDTSVDPQILEVLEEPMIEANAQAAMLTYPGGPDQANGYYSIIATFFGPTNEGERIHAPGEEFYEILTQSVDPRHDLFLDDPFDQGPPNGFFPGFTNPDYAVFSDHIIRDDYPDVYFLPAEITFYRSELAMKGVTSENAQELYELGVRQSIDFWNTSIPGALNSIDNSEIDAFISSLGQVTSRSLQEQQYMETFLRPIVAWNHVRRNEYPMMKPVPGSTIAWLPRRLYYSRSEISRNSNTPPNKSLTEKMWFEIP